LRFSTPQGDFLTVCLMPFLVAFVTAHLRVFTSVYVLLTHVAGGTSFSPFTAHFVSIHGVGRYEDPSPEQATMVPIHGLACPSHA
jgi:hypothetical protein